MNESEGIAKRTNEFNEQARYRADVAGVLAKISQLDIYFGIRFTKWWKETGEKQFQDYILKGD